MRRFPRILPSAKFITRAIHNRHAPISSIRKGIAGHSVLSMRSFSQSSNDALPDSAKPLPYRKLPFDSIEIDVDEISVNDTAEFGTRLWFTISEAKAKGTNAVFLKIPMLFAHYVPVAGMYGFRYHHAEGEVSTLLLWLPTNVECKVPPFATHHVGVAGAVILPDESSNKITANSKILLVRERSKRAAGWKLPGGYANLGEDFSKAAVREIMEETGIKARFDSVLTVRHSNNIQFGRDDIYVICKMQLDNAAAAAASADQKITIDSEIDDAIWMPLGQFRDSTKHPMLQTVADLLLKDAKGLTETEMPSPVRGRNFKLYHP